MNIDIFIRANYSAACNMQRSIEKDQYMKDMLVNGDKNTRTVKSWMRDYGLFRGIAADYREKIANKFLSFVESHDSTINIVNDDALKQIYSELFTALFNVINRSWMSATSKLLWCVYPNDVVIYDSFVERALIVMQCLDDELAQFPRIGVAPGVKHAQEITLATSYYMNYQKMVRHIYDRNRLLLDELRHKHDEIYPHDIRIIDKLLWMIGNPKQSFST